MLGNVQVYRPLASLDGELKTITDAITDLQGLSDLLATKPLIVDPPKPKSLGTVALLPIPVPAPARAMLSSNKRGGKVPGPALLVESHQLPSHSLVEVSRSSWASAHSGAYWVLVSAVVVLCSLVLHWSRRRGCFRLMTYFIVTALLFSYLFSICWWVQVEVLAAVAVPRVQWDGPASAPALAFDHVSFKYPPRPETEAPASSTQGGVRTCSGASTLAGTGLDPGGYQACERVLLVDVVFSVCLGVHLFVTLFSASAG